MTMRLFRQQKIGDWNTVMQKVAEALQNEPSPDGSKLSESV